MKTMVMMVGMALSASALAGPESVPPDTQAPGFYRMTLGKLRITAVSDGTVTIPLDKLLTHISPQQLRDRMASDAMTPQAETSINAYVIDNGQQRVLVDAGAGDLFGHNGGHLLENLAAAGYPAESLNAVLLTHIHADHSGGVSRSGKLAFPNAR
ncbi:MAG TPA: MBL fold metallo-hydrolase, partial [Erwinia persicina]|nr:MBL fold metallo-hydrolase [Erwinia persicina]